MDLLFTSSTRRSVLPLSPFASVRVPSSDSAALLNDVNTKHEIHSRGASSEVLIKHVFLQLYPRPELKDFPFIRQQRTRVTLNMIFYVAAENCQRSKSTYILISLVRKQAMSRCASRTSCLVLSLCPRRECILRFQSAVPRKEFLHNSVPGLISSVCRIMTSLLEHLALLCIHTFDAL